MTDETLAVAWTDEEKAQFTADIRKVYEHMPRVALFMLIREKERLLAELDANPTILGDEVATAVYAERIRLMVTDLASLHQEALEAFETHLTSLSVAELVEHLMDSVAEDGLHRAALEELFSATEGEPEVDEATEDTRRMMIHFRRDSSLFCFYETTRIAVELTRRHTE